MQISKQVKTCHSLLLVHRNFRVKNGDDARYYTPHMSSQKESLLAKDSGNVNNAKLLNRLVSGNTVIVLRSSYPPVHGTVIATELLHITDIWTPRLKTAEPGRSLYIVNTLPHILGTFIRGGKDGQQPHIFSCYLRTYLMTIGYSIALLQSPLAWNRNIFASMTQFFSI